jgi:peptidyl-dipeptidase Dcp
LKQKLFNFDDEILKPYFKLENVLNGLYYCRKTVWNYFQRSFDIDKYKDVQTFEVWISKDNWLLFFMLIFPKKRKRNGAWMTSYKSQAIKNEQEGSMKDHMFLSFVISHLNRD